MHEFSVVSSLLENCERIAKENQASKVLAIHLEIGERSGVNPDLLKKAFLDFKVGSICEDAELFIVFVKVNLFCEDCKQSSEVVGINYTQCPLCGSPSVKMIKGNEMLLLRLEME
ncbi:hydrogenase/urease nickel incorporation protein HypA [Helicobacter mesocricetorum]|uniref:hydrogenase/urease nickel incorporation protein HypA n=1 Tax=Helicobacter mesocricetorum TaxID=87012 RepID=UPI000CF137B2|nr:hydrogenase/urease nickel incorporation protein HypA [Helicobacter mesocricetorum]